MVGAQGLEPRTSCNDTGRGLFDVVVVWRLDRFACSVKQFVLALEEFRALGIDFISHAPIKRGLGQALNTVPPAGQVRHRRQCSLRLNLLPSANYVEAVTPRRRAPK